MTGRARTIVLITIVLAVAGSGCIVAADADWRDTDPNETVEIAAGEPIEDEELDAAVDRTMVRVEELRAVRFETRPDVELISREEAMDRRATPNLSERTTAFTNVVERAPFFVGDDADAVAVRADNQNATIGGYYRIGEDEIVLVSVDEDEAVLDERTLAHELLHAWQDRRYDLSEYRGDTRDESSALMGLTEGDPVYLEVRYGERCDIRWECLRPPRPTAGDADLNWGLYLADFHPYSDGPAFVEVIHEEGGWAAVNDVYDEPPRATRHIAEPETYGRVSPQRIVLRDTHNDDWSRLRPSDGPDAERLGQARLGAMFAQTPFVAENDERRSDPPLHRDEVLNEDEAGEIPRMDPVNYTYPFADGWTGDRFHAYERGDDRGYVWRIAWESDEDAAAFLDAYADLLRFFGAEPVEADVWTSDDEAFPGAYAYDRTGSTVTIVHAPSVEEIPAVSAEVGSAVGLIDEPPRIAPRLGPEPPAPAPAAPLAIIGLVVGSLWMAATGLAYAGRRED